MKSGFCFIIVAFLLFSTIALLPAQTHTGKTIPNENDLLTEYYILEENSDSTECYLYLFESSNNYMLIINYHIAPGLSRSYFLSQGEYTDINRQLIFHDDVNNLMMKAVRDDADDLIFEQGLDFMPGEIFAFVEKTTQLPGPPYTYNIFPEKTIQAAIDQAKTTETNDNVNSYHFQTKMFSDHILADLKLNTDQTFTYRFMHYPLMQGAWQQENRLIMLTSESGYDSYGSIHPDLPDFTVIQLPGFIFESYDNQSLYQVKE